MKKNKKINVVLVGFDRVERNSINLYCGDRQERKFPFVSHVSTLEEAFNKQGFLLIIHGDLVSDIYEFDKKYRCKLSKYCLVFVYKNIKETYFKFSNIRTIDEYYLYNDSLMYQLDDLYEEYYDSFKAFNYTKKRMEQINLLFNYLKDKNKITSDVISVDLNISLRQVQRYMVDVNDVYNCIGYNYSLNEWYIIKNVIK